MINKTKFNYKNNKFNNCCLKKTNLVNKYKRLQQKVINNLSKKRKKNLLKKLKVGFKCSND